METNSVGSVESETKSEEPKTKHAETPTWQEVLWSSQLRTSGTLD